MLREGYLTLEIIFEVQRKRSNENIARKKKSFQDTKYVFVFFSPFSLDLSYFQSLLIFKFLVNLK
jgi:hypothetical protein